GGHINGERNGTYRLEKENGWIFSRRVICPRYRGLRIVLSRWKEMGLTLNGPTRGRLGGTRVVKEQAPGHPQRGLTRKAQVANGSPK
ncbi:hypothetical protein Ancab_010094, partial [Ancistrocladus abbreviatus]